MIDRSAAFTRKKVLFWQDRELSIFFNFSSRAGQTILFVVLRTSPRKVCRDCETRPDHPRMVVCGWRLQTGSRSWDMGQRTRASAIRFQRVKEGAGLAFELVNLRKAVKLFEPVQIKIRLDFYIKLRVSIWQLLNFHGIADSPIRKIIYYSLLLNKFYLFEFFRILDEIYLDFQDWVIFYSCKVMLDFHNLKKIWFVMT